MGGVVNVSRYWRSFAWTARGRRAIVRDPMYRDPEELSNAELRATPDLVIVFRVHFSWATPDLDDEIVEPVALTRQRFVPFITPRLRLDARDLRGVDFYWRKLDKLDDRVLDRVKAHLLQETEIHLYLRRLERACRADVTDS